MAIQINGSTGVSGVNGTGANPVYSGGDSDTGIFFPALGQVAITTNGVQRLLITETGDIQSASVLSFPGGSASAPSIAFTGDTDTGLYSPSANSVAISTGGSGRLFVDASGNVGVAAAPSAFGTRTAIQLNGSTSNWFAGGVNGITLFSRNIYNDGSNKFIGTGFASIYYQSTAGDHVWERSSASGTAGAAATMLEALRITSAGLVGIGTSSPAAIFSSKPSASSTTAATTFTGDGLFIDCANTTDGIGNYGGAISWSRSGSSTTRAAAITNVQTGSDSDVQGLAFLTHSSGTSTNPLIEAMRITGAGLVGIGTSSPSNLLNVEGSGTTAIAQVVNTSSFTGGTNFTNPHFTLRSGNDTTGNVTRLSLLVGTGGQTYIESLLEDGATVAASTVFRNRGADGVAERMRITSTGRVGIGFAAPPERLSINDSNANAYVLVRSGIVNGDAAVKFNLNDVNYGGIGLENTALVMRCSNSSTPAERARIDSSGRLLVGTSSASGEGLLRVSGGSGTNVGVIEIGSNTARPTAADSELSKVIFTSGSNSNAYASITAFSDGASSSTVDIPGRLVFSTTADGASSPTERMRITNDGKIGIANNGVIQQGSGIGGGSAAGILELYNGGTGNTTLENTGAFPILFKTNGSERLRITSAGLVGIGTSSPGFPFQVKSTTNAHVAIWDNGGIPQVLGVNDAGGSAQLRLAGQILSFTGSGGAGSEHMRLDALGRLGIGTTSPGQALSVAGNISSSAVGTNYVASSSQGVTTSYLITDTSGGNIQVDGAWPIRFTTNSNERARIDSSGRLLVGTSSSRSYTSLGNPQLQLEGIAYAQSSIGLTNNQNVADGSYIVFNKTRGTSVGSNTIVQTGDSLGAIWFQGTDGSASVLSSTIACAVEGTPAANKIASRLVFSTTEDGASSPTERMRITNNGTMSAFASVGDAIIGATGSAAGSVATVFSLNNSATSTTTGTTCLYVFTNGDVRNTNNSYGAISDIKLKENIVDANSQWDDIKALQVRKYNFKQETGHQTHTQIGLVAQEVELVSPGLVSESPDRDAEGNDLGTVTKSVNYSVLYMKAVKALQEAMERIETLEAENAHQKASLTDILSRISALEGA